MREMDASALVMDHDWVRDVATVAVCGEVDLTTVAVLSEYLDDLVIRNPERLIIDLANVGFLDCSGVHAIVHARHRLSADCAVILRSPGRLVRRIFELTGLESLCIVE